LAASGKAVAPTRLIASTRFDGNPQVSPDDKRIAFTSDRSGFYEIWLSDRDGRNPVQFTSFNAPMTASPRWSPDGQRIAFDSQSGSNRDIYVAGIGGESPRRLTTEPSEEARPCWSNDGRWLYFMSTRSGSRQIWRVPSAGGPAVEITRGGGYECQASPDGELLYYTKGATALWSVPVDGGEERPAIAGVTLGSWVVGQQGIYFVDFASATTPGAPKPVKLWHFAGGAITGVALLDGQLDSGRRMLAISPGDRWLLWSQTDVADSDLMLVEAFR
jgi:Tol biopolymer transport system component